MTLIFIGSVLCCFFSVVCMLLNLRCLKLLLYEAQEAEERAGLLKRALSVNAKMLDSSVELSLLSLKTLLNKRGIGDTDAALERLASAREEQCAFIKEQENT